MIKTLTNVGNSKALILPKRLIDKYKLDKVTIRETEEGILIIPAEEKASSFHEKLKALRDNKDLVYARMKDQSEEPETIAHYQGNDLSEVDVDFIEE